MDQDGGFGGANGPKGGPGGGGAGFGRGGKIFDDLAGVAGGAFSALTGLRNEAEAVFRAQAESMLQRLDLVRREDLDAAMELVEKVVPPPSSGEREKALEKALPQLASLGLTGVHDMGTSPADWALFRTFGDEGRLTLRMPTAVICSTCLSSRMRAITQAWLSGSPA